MFYLTRTHLVAGLCSTLVLTLVTGAAAQVRDTPKRTARPPAQVQPRVTVGQKPASASEINALHSGFRSALSVPKVRAAATAEIQRQLRHNRPIALVDGAWATPINLGALYGHGSIRPSISAKTSGSISAARTDVLLAGNLKGAVGIVFTPANIGKELLGGVARDLVNSMSEDALKANMTGGMSGDQNFFIAILPGIIQLFQDFWDWMTGDDDVAPDPTAPTSDPDGDNLANKDDADDDGDGTNDDEDSHPYDPSASICHDCQSILGISFTPTSSVQVMKVVLNAHSTAVNAARAKAGIRLGALSAGQRALNLGAAFAPGIQ